MAAVKRALQDYCNELEDSDLSDGIKGMYGDFAECFVRYLEGTGEETGSVRTTGTEERSFLEMTTIR
jgi:hypothetical protein